MLLSEQAEPQPFAVTLCARLGSLPPSAGAGSGSPCLTQETAVHWRMVSHAKGNTLLQEGSLLSSAVVSSAGRTEQAFVTEAAFHQQELPQQETVVVRCSLPWMLLMVLLQAISPLGTAGAPAAE